MQSTPAAPAMPETARKGNPKSAHEFLPPESLDMTTSMSRWRLGIGGQLIKTLLAVESDKPFSLLRENPVALATETTIRTGYMMNAQISYLRQKMAFETSPECIPEDMVGEYSVMRFRVGSMAERGANPDLWEDINHWNTLYPEVFFLIERFSSNYHIRGTYVLPCRSNGPRFELNETSEVFQDLDINRTGLDVVAVTRPVFNKATMEGFGIPFLMRQWSNLFQWSDPAHVPDRYNLERS